MVDPFLLEGFQIRSADILKMNAVIRYLKDARLSPRFALGAAASIFLGLASMGCQSTSPAKQSAGDPILGEIHPQNNRFGPTPPASASTGTGNTHGAAAPSPTNNAVTVSPTSPAYLASMPKMLPDASPLSIGDRPFGRATLPTVIPVPRETNGLLTNNPNNSGPAWDRSTSAPIQQTGNILSGFVDPNEALLKSRGIVSQKQEQVAGGGIRLTAIAPNPSNPGAFRTFEVQARDYPAAVQAILQQIDGKR